MLETLKNAFKIKDVRRRIYYVVLMLVIVRIGSQLPIPGVTEISLNNCLQISQTMRLTFSMHLQVGLSRPCLFLH